MSLAQAGDYSSKTRVKVIRKTVGLTIRQDLLRIAREYDINLSKTLETSLIQLFDAQTSIPFRNTRFLGTASFVKEGVAGPEGFEPSFSGSEEPFLRKSFTKNAFSLKWLEDRERLEAWLNSEDYSPDFKTDVLSYLSRYVVEIREPFDIVSVFGKIKKGKRHLALALRTLFNFYEAVGISSAYLDYLRKAIPNVRCGIDLKIPSETRILDSLGKLSRMPVKYQATYHLLLDSGLRLAEAVELINSFQDAELVNGFYRCEVAMFRGEKQAYYGHFTERTLDLIKQVSEKLERNSTSSYFRKWGLVASKYLRKFAFDKMIELEVPESVADFIEGRVPQRIGAKHYLALARQSAKFYPRYQVYIEKLKAHA